MGHSQWQELLTLGNDCYQNNQLRQCEFFYSEAYDILAYGYRNNPLSSDILMAWICTCHNLSTLYETMGDLDLSLKFLKVPYDYLVEISESDIPDEEVKLIAFKGISLTVTPILLFVKKHPMCEDCISKLGSLKKVIEQETALVH